MDFSGITAHLPSTVAGLLIFAISGAVGAGWISQETATVAIGIIAGIGGILFKHSNQ